MNRSRFIPLFLTAASLALLFVASTPQSLGAQGLGFCNECQVTWYPDGMVCDACVIYTFYGGSNCQNPSCYNCILSGSCGQMAQALPEVLQSVQDSTGTSDVHPSLDVETMLLFNGGSEGACAAFEDVQALLVRGMLWDGVWYS